MHYHTGLEQDRHETSEVKCKQKCTEHHLDFIWLRDTCKWSVKVPRCFACVTDCILSALSSALAFTLRRCCAHVSLAEVLALSLLQFPVDHLMTPEIWLKFIS